MIEHGSANVNLWEMTAQVSFPCVVDEVEVRRGLEILLSPGSHEIRGLPSARSAEVSGKRIDEAVEIVKTFGSERGVYFTLNPVKPGLGTRAANVHDIVARYWLLIDIDRKKTEADIEMMATDVEKSWCLNLAAQIADWLISEGWPPPVIVDSGNGAHLLFRIDLPASELSRTILKQVLIALAKRWDTSQAEVDQKVFSTSRISKLPGTWVRKGENVPERPWRMARLIWVPESLGIVSADQLQALTVKSKPPPDIEPILSPWDQVYQASPDKQDAYVRSGISRELAALALASPGNRNDALNKASFALGQFIGAGVLDRRDAERQLSAVASGLGLGDHEVNATIKSGLDSGIQKPHKLPTPGPKPSTNGTHATLPPGISPIVWGNTIKPKKIDWLVPGRIPANKMTTFAGQTGMGKTFAVCDLAARITTGGEIPFSGGLCFDAGTVLIISAEDDADDTLLPRFIDLGGDSRKLAFLSPEAEDHFSLAALDLLGKSLDAMGPDVRMIAIDPPTSYLGTVNDHKNAELRGLLTPIKRFCKIRNVPLIFITHVNKAMGQKIDAMARVMGSVAWVAAVRAAHMFCQDPEIPGKRLYVPLKVNNSESPKALRYIIEKQPNGGGLIKWLEEVEMTADEAIGNVKRKSRGVVATEWLTAQFQSRRQWESDELHKAAKEAGLSRSALWTPEVNALPIFKKKRVNAAGEPCWMWIADDGWPPVQNKTDTVEILETVDTQVPY